MAVLVLLIAVARLLAMVRRGRQRMASDAPRIPA